MPAIPGKREDHPPRWPLWVAAAPMLAFLVYKASYLLYPDLAFTYPWTTWDGFQWILEGLRLRGHDVRSWGRNPGLPVVLAALGAVADARWLPVLTCALLALFSFELARFLLARFSPAVTALTLLLLFFNFAVQTFFDYVLADPWALTFELMAIRQLALAARDPRRLFAAAALAALSFHFQYAIAWVAPAFLAFYLLEIRPAHGARADKLAIASAALGIALISPPFVYKAIVHHDPFHTDVIQGPLVVPHLFGVGFYLFNSLAFFGVPAALLVAVGAWKGLRERGASLLVNLCALCTASFWIFLYEWLDPRFLLYLVPFAAWMIARGIETAGLGSPARALVTMALVTYGILLGAADRGSPFASARLPLTPKHELVIGNVPISKWDANVTISFARWRVDKKAHGIGAGAFLFQRYPRYRRDVDPARLEDLRELREAARAADGAGISRCGPLPDDFISGAMREIALERKEQQCASGAARLYPSGGDVPAARVLFAGRHYQLLAPP